MKNTFDDVYYKAIGEELRKARISNHYSYDKVALLLNGHKSKSMLIRYESGQYRIDNDTLEKLCTIYGVKSEYIRSNAYDTTFKRIYFDKDYDFNDGLDVDDIDINNIPSEKELINREPISRISTPSHGMMPRKSQIAMARGLERELVLEFRKLTESQQNIILDLIKELSK